MTTLSLLLIGALNLTSYRSVPNQTDSSPFITADGSHVCAHGVAVSRDLLCSNPRNKKRESPTCLNYGDWVFVEGFGVKIVNDTMNKRHRHHIDVWVGTYKEEKRIGVRKDVKVWRIYENN